MKPTLVNFNTLVDDKHKIVYCQVQKAASSFWATTLQFLQDPEYYVSPYNLSIFDVKIPLKVRSNYSNQSKWFSSDFFRFTFVRDPYSRLFSGYIDKLYNLNIPYWRAIGTVIVKTVRGFDENHCGHDITFSEFVKYIILAEKNLIKRDRHFTPINEHCSPCALEYDVIGKLENREETKYILSILAPRMNVSLEVALNIDKPPVEDVLRSRAHDLYKINTTVERCFSFHAAMKRIWAKLQIEGLLGRNVSMPFSEDETSDVTESAFTDALFRAMSMSGDNESRKHNTRDALQEAYSMVPMSDLLLLQKAVRHDCELFQYDPKPDYIFKRRNERNVDNTFFDFES